MQLYDSVWCIAPDYRDVAEGNDLPRMPWLGAILEVPVSSLHGMFKVETKVHGLCAFCRQNEIFRTKDQANIAYTNVMLEEITQTGIHLKNLAATLKDWLSSLNEKQRTAIAASCEEIAKLP